MSHPTSIKGVLLVNGRVLLVKNPRSEWELPGGRGEIGEDHGQTLLREFKEELSVEIAIAHPIDSYLFEVIPGRHVFIVTYGCRLAGEFEPRLSDEHTAQCLWPIGRLSELNLPLGVGARSRNGQPLFRLVRRKAPEITSWANMRRSTDCEGSICKGHL